jgi:hypothetical protein
MAAPTFEVFNGADKCVQLNAGQFGFPLPFGTNWNALRLAFLINFTDTGGNITTPQFLWGAASGSANWPGDASCDNFIGFGTVAQLTRVAGPPVRYSVGASDFKGYRKVGVTLTAGTNAGNVPLFLAGGTSTCLAGIQITKGSPNFTAKGFCTTATSGHTVSHLVTMLEQYTLTALTGVGVAADSAQAIDEGANGALNHAVICWDRGVNIFITHVGIVRIS